jgi:hypothetical protein
MALGLNQISRPKKRITDDNHKLLLETNEKDDDKARPWQNSDHRPLRTRTLKAKMAVEKARKKVSFDFFFPLAENHSSHNEHSHELSEERIPSLNEKKKKTAGAFAFLSYLFG